MKYQFEETRMQSVAVPTRVVDGLLGIATGAQLKVLLFLMRFDKLAHEEKESAKFCNIPEEEVERAIDFWVKERIFVKEQGKLRLVSGIKTVQPKELPRVQPTIILEETSKDFRDMIGEIQRVIGKPINSLTVSLFYNMAENLHFSPEMIVQLVAYCNSIGKFSYRYMETVATSWYDEGIDTFEKAEEQIRRLEESRALESRLARAFGISTSFSAKQKEQIGAWAALGLSEALILEAYNRCMDRNSKMSFPYMNKILEDWANKGYKKVSDIEDAKPLPTGRQQHEGLSELERIAIERMQAGGQK